MRRHYRFSRRRRRRDSVCAQPLGGADALCRRRHAGDRQQLAERALRGIAITRKNFLFLGSEAGGERAAILYTVLESAKLNGLNIPTHISPTDRPHGRRAFQREPDQPPWRNVAVELAAPACQNGGMRADAIAVLRIELIDIEPLIWRRVAVKTATNLQTLHRIIQAVMGWLDYHLWSAPALGYRYMRERRFRLQRNQ